METQYSTGTFLTSLVERLQDACRSHLNYNQFVEVSGYVCVEIDNMKKERYVLSELLQSSGNSVSESFCTKVLSPGSQKLRSESGHTYLEEKNYVAQRNPNYSSDRVHRLAQHEGYFLEHPRAVTSQKVIPGSKTVRNSSVASVSSVEEVVPQLAQGSPCKSGPLAEDYDSQSNTGNRACRSLSSSSSPIGRKRTSQSQQVVADLQRSPGCVSDRVSASMEDEEVIDLDMFEDEQQEEEEVSLLPGAMQEDDILRYGTGSGQQRKCQLSPGTLSTVRNSVKQFKKFIYDRSGLDTDLLSTPPERLNMLLLDYFREAKKMDGCEFTARTLKNLQVRLDMFLQDGGYPFSIIKDRQFQSSRDYLKKRITESGKSIAQLHSPVDDNDVELLFEANQLGAHSCEVLTNTMWFMNSKYFAIRRPAEHFNMKWGDVTLQVDDQGQEYVSRPIQGSIFLKVYAKPEMPNRCFVNFYKQYRVMRPKHMSDEASPFYLKINRNFPEELGFCPEAMNYSHFIHIWRKMVQVSRLPSDKKIF